MTITEMSEVVKNALDEYRKAKATNNKTIIERVYKDAYVCHEADILI